MRARFRLLFRFNVCSAGLRCSLLPTDIATTPKRRQSHVTNCARSAHAFDNMLLGLLSEFGGDAAALIIDTPLDICAIAVTSASPVAGRWPPGFERLAPPTAGDVADAGCHDAFSELTLPFNTGRRAKFGIFRAPNNRRGVYR